MIPSSILRIWCLGLFSFVLVGADVYFGHQWYKRAWSYDSEHQRSYFDPHLGFNHATLCLTIAVVLLVWALAGGLILRGILGLFTKPNASPSPTETTWPAQHAVTRSRLGQADSSELNVEVYGPEDAPTIVLTHGWGADRTEWNYLIRAVADRFRLVTWDLPGLGRSSQPINHDYGLENLARDLEAVLGVAGPRPVVLLGHSIGGMIILTFYRLFAKELGLRISGLALVQTTYTNPVRTTTLAGLLTALERPLIRPLLHLTIRLAPLVWLSNWLSYLNGSSHLSTKLSGFAGTESWGQMDHVTRLGIKAWPAVLARGMFGMLRYDATETLRTVQVPTLIIAGDRDPVCRPVASERMHRDIAGSQLTFLAPAKHMGLIEHHARFAERVSEFAHACLSGSRPGSTGGTAPRTRPSGDQRNPR
ncbi:MAG: alpha/beta hydrolase [Verrucomicrobia bacterium]|nr:alpha/beta hydrolase [Verrucomicrobiota bacterium]